MKLDTYNNGIRSGVIFVPENVPTYLSLEYVDPGTPPFVVRLRLFVSPYIECDVSQFFAVRADAMTELDRIAALISGEAASVGQGWVEGAPPPTDGAWFVVVDEDRNIHVVQCVQPASPKPWETAAGYPYASSEFTHHLPTPIQPPKETP